jgi:hypothetical protein
MYKHTDFVMPTFLLNLCQTNSRNLLVQEKGKDKYKGENKMAEKNNQAGEIAELLYIKGIVSRDYRVIQLI